MKKSTDFYNDAPGGGMPTNQHNGTSKPVAGKTKYVGTTKPTSGVSVPNNQPSDNKGQNAKAKEPLSARQVLGE